MGAIFMKFGRAATTQTMWCAAAHASALWTELVVQSETEVGAEFGVEVAAEFGAEVSIALVPARNEN
jgi:hypothetical protein